MMMNEPWLRKNPLRSQSKFLSNYGKELIVSMRSKTQDQEAEHTKPTRRIKDVLTQFHTMSLITDLEVQYQYGCLYGRRNGKIVILWNDHHKILHINHSFKEPDLIAFKFLFNIPSERITEEYTLEDLTEKWDIGKYE